MKHFCCICFDNLKNKPSQIDWIYGDVYCPQHSGLMSEMIFDVNVGKCPECNFRYYKYSPTLTANPECPHCKSRL